MKNLGHNKTFVMKTDKDKIDSYWLNKFERNARFYFAYGSNINQEQMEFRCNDALPAAVAYVQNYKFVINSSGVATIFPASGLVVRGVLWQISKSDEDELDIYEGVSSNLYNKEICAVSVGNEKVDSLVYIATNSEFGSPRKNYLETIINGIVSFNGHKEWLDEVRSWSGFYK